MVRTLGKLLLWVAILACLAVAVVPHFTGRPIGPSPPRDPAGVRHPA
ncbi:hypothetical protein [Sphingomonas metalli]|nr:hypothetical protein [Sphingomonas metalli]